MEIKAQIGLKFMDLLPIRPGMKYCSNWVEIHGFTPNLTGHKLLVKLAGNSLRLQYRLMKNKNKVHNTSEVDFARKSAGFIKLLHF